MDIKIHGTFFLGEGSRVDGVVNGVTATSVGRKIHGTFSFGDNSGFKG